MGIYPLKNTAKMRKIGLGKMLDGRWRIVTHRAMYQFDERPPRRRKRYQFCAAVLRVRLACNQASILKIIHRDGNGRSVAAGHIDQLFQGDRRIEQPPKHANAAEGQASDLRDFSAPFAAGLPYHGDQHLPDAIGFAATAGMPGHAAAPVGASSSRCAAWRVVLRAQRVFDSHASNNTATPPPVISHQKGCDASANPLCICVPRMVPARATPSAAPICLLVEATAAARPACALVMPDTAVLVMGAFTMPKPIPKITYVSSNIGSGVAAVNCVMINALMTVAAPETSSGGCVPYAPTNRPESGEQRMVASASGMVHRPVWKADKPRTSCKYSVLRNRKPENAEKLHTAINVALLKGALRKNRISISGSWRRGS